MSAAVSSVTSVEPTGSSGMTRMLESLGNSIEHHESRIRGSIIDGLDPNGDVMGIPKHIKDQFASWDAQFTAPEDRKLVEDLKNKVMEITTANQDYIRGKVERNADKMQLELAMKAVSKTTQGIQQILSSQ